MPCSSGAPKLHVSCAPPSSRRAEIDAGCSASFVGAGATYTVHCAAAPAVELTVMTALPAPRATMRPVRLTVATAASELAKLSPALEPSPLTLAFRLARWPTASVTLWALSVTMALWARTLTGSVAMSAP